MLLLAFSGSRCVTFTRVQPVSRIQRRHGVPWFQLYALTSVRYYSKRRPQDQPSTEIKDKDDNRTPLYEYGPLSTEDTLLCEMRYRETPWSQVGQAFGVHPLVVFHRYIKVGSTALKHHWQPRMTAKDIDEYIQARSAHA